MRINFKNLFRVKQFTFSRISNFFKRQFHQSKRNFQQEGGQQQKKSKFSRKIGALIGTILSISGAAGVYITQYLSSESYYRRKAETRLLFGVKVVEPSEYISRGEIEEELNRLFEQDTPHKYYIIAGPTGSGKTTLIKHVISGKNAVIMFRVDETTGLLVAQEKILSELGINATQFSIRKEWMSE